MEGRVPESWCIVEFPFKPEFQMFNFFLLLLMSSSVLVCSMKFHSGLGSVRVPFQRCHLCPRPQAELQVSCSGCGRSLRHITSVFTVGCSFRI